MKNEKEIRQKIENYDDLIHGLIETNKDLDEQKIHSEIEKEYKKELKSCNRLSIIYLKEKKNLLKWLLENEE